MKKQFYLGMTLLAAAMFTACENADNPVIDVPTTQTVTVSFENQTLNADGYWIGVETDDNYSYTDGYGGTYTAYANTYEENGLTLNTTFTVYSSEWGTSNFWSGFAISSRTETNFTSPYTADQYNNVAGGAHSGRNFCIVQTYGETIDIPVEGGVLLKSLYYTNSAYTVNSIVNGDSYSGDAFSDTDWLTCTINATRIDGTTASLDIELAKEGTYVSDWQQADLSPLGTVKSLSFVFTGSRNNEWGLLTPAYICIDDLTFEVAK